jgi:hypothetical protein
MFPVYSMDASAPLTSSRPGRRARSARADPRTMEWRYSPQYAGRSMRSYQVAVIADGAEAHAGTLRDTIVEIVLGGLR